MKKALIIVDVQNDFCPGGALAVPNGNHVIVPLNRTVDHATAAVNRANWVISASRDWHPAGHCSFKEQGGPWPPHCVQNTLGACFHPWLNINELDNFVFDKGFKRDEDSYSAFGGNTMLGKLYWNISFSMEEMLRKLEIQELYIGGLATDYCVKATALDAVRLGFKTYLLTDACRAVNVKPGDEALALNEMENAGVKFVYTDEVIRGY